VGADDAQRVALLSIRPEFAHAIFAGDKTVEFRRAPLASDIKVALVYATVPVGQVIGWFTIARIAASTPGGLWRRFARHGAITKRAYFDYFDGASRAFGIEIATVVGLEPSLALEELVPGLRAPQSFQYLAAADVAPALAVAAAS
jgi:predicted transcriptional regulator